MTKRPKLPQQILMEKYLDELVPPHDGQVQWGSERRFCERRWRFDYVVTWALSGGPKLAIEIEGGTWVYGRHSRGKGYQADLDKYNEAAIRGWTILRFSTQDVLTGKAKDVINRWLDACASR